VRATRRSAQLRFLFAGEIKKGEKKEKKKKRKKKEKGKKIIARERNNARPAQPAGCDEGRRGGGKGIGNRARRA